MMKYEISHNFIPKESKPTIPLDTKFQEQNKALQDENNKYLSTIEAYERKIDEMQEELFHKENELNEVLNKIAFLEDSIKNFEDLKNDLDKVDHFKVETNTLSKKITTLNQENVVLKDELASSKQHIQTLYLMLLILAVL